MTIQTALALIGFTAMTCTHPAIAQEAPPKRDRQAILHMAGEFRVNFQFHETVPVEPGYELHEPYRTHATEFVEVVEDRHDFISLQHVLVLHDEDDDQPKVVKHWRQDWTYQDTDLLVFRGGRTWERVELTPEEASGTWTQAVYQVDDSPRYEGIGRWTHTAGRSAWQSTETWRPLPRREYTHRDDYHVLVARNRHTITPHGWAHEQDNYKLVLDDNGQPHRVLAHESGLNVYQRVSDVDFSAGRRRWHATAPYWREVRKIRDDLLGPRRRVTLQAKVSGQRLNQIMSAMANDAAHAGDHDVKLMRPIIRDRIAAFITE